MLSVIHFCNCTYVTSDMMHNVAFPGYIFAQNGFLVLSPLDDAAIVVVHAGVQPKLQKGSMCFNKCIILYSCCCLGLTS